MRIDDANRSPQTQALEKANAGPASNSRASKAQDGGTDKADISALAKALQPTDPQRLEKTPARCPKRTLQGFQREGCRRRPERRAFGLESPRDSPPKLCNYAAVFGIHWTQVRYLIQG